MSRPRTGVFSTAALNAANDRIAELEAQLFAAQREVLTQKLARIESEKLIGQLVEALRRVKHVAPLGVDTYPECYKQIQAIVGAALAKVDA